MRKLSCLVFLFLLSILLPAQESMSIKIGRLKEQFREDSTDAKTLKELGFIYLRRADYLQAIDYGQRLFQIANQTEDYNTNLLYAHIIIGQAYTMVGNTKAYHHLMQAQTIGEIQKNDSALCSVFNGLGLYNCNINRDYYSAIHYLFQGLEVAKRCQYYELEGLLMGNISNVYFLKKDTTGLSYSLATYEMGHNQHSSYLVYVGSINAAYMYYLRNSYEEALRYIKESEFIMQQNDLYDQGNIYALYGLILSAQGKYNEAIQYLKKGLSFKEYNQTSSELFLLHSYAQTLLAQQHPLEAIKLVQQAMEIGRKKNCITHYEELVELLSRCYEACGQYEKALYWQRLLLQDVKEIFNSDKEQTLSNLRIRYDMERRENEVKQHKLELLQREKREQLMLVVLVVILLVSLGLFLLYQRKNRLYTAIVRQKQEAIRREQQLENTIRSMKEHVSSECLITKDTEKSEKKYVTSSLSDEKKISLFQRLELCMLEQAIYRDNFLTKEKVAELLDTNRTYLSQVINEQTGKTFTQYINHYRINEATRLLSDHQSSLSLKAISSRVGFSSMTTFYKVFQNTIGISPKEYREKVLQLSDSLVEND